MWLTTTRNAADPLPLLLCPFEQETTVQASMPAPSPLYYIDSQQEGDDGVGARPCTSFDAARPTRARRTAAAYLSPVEKLGMLVCRKGGLIWRVAL